MFTHAIVRKPGENFASGLTTSNLGKPSYKRMLEQHQKYIKTLEEIGLQVEVLDALPDFPDAYFVEDTAVVTPRMAVLTNPGAKTRNGEIKAMKPVLEKYKKVIPIQAPGTVDGGDVLMMGNHFFIGVSERTNQQGAEQLQKILEADKYTAELIPVGEGLHLKSSINGIGENTLLLTEIFMDHAAFSPYQKIMVEEEEAYAANTLWINDYLLIPKGFPKTKRKLENVGKKIIELDIDEARKMDGGLTCMSLRF